MPRASRASSGMPRTKPRIERNAARELRTERNAARELRSEYEKDTGEYNPVPF